MPTTPNLRILGLCNIMLTVVRTNVGSDGAEIIARHLPYLNELKIGWNPITDVAIYHLCQGLIDLRILSLYRTCVGEEGVEQISRCFSKLVNLNVCKL